jgi:hypothetical protein
MSLLAEDRYLADLVSDLSDALSMFSNEAARLSVLLARSEVPVSAENYYELRKQCMLEVSSFRRISEPKGRNICLPQRGIATFLSYWPTLLLNFFHRVLTGSVFSKLPGKAEFRFFHDFIF